MEPSNFDNLKNVILRDETLRWYEIYKITCISNNKIYVGQTVSHILNHEAYRPFGIEGRFRGHISEAFSSKKNQSHYLNNAIRKYGVENFTITLIERCKKENADERERYNILELNSLFPHGYNLKIGGQNFIHCDESKKRVSNGVMNYYKDKKAQRFKDIDIDDIDDDIDKYIHPLNKRGKQYGWYVLIQKCKADFGGIHISLDDSLMSATNFILNLKNPNGETP